MSKKKKKHGPLLAIDIGSSSIKFSQGQMSNGRLKVSLLGIKPVPDGVYGNGNIHDYQTLKAIITGSLHDFKIKNKDTVVTIESSDTIKREMVIQKVPDEDKADLIAYEVSQYLPIEISNYILQYKDIEEFVEDDVKKVKIHLGAMPKEIVKAHFDLINECGLNPCYLDMHSNSLEKLIQYERSNISSSQLSCAYIDFGHKMINVTLFENQDYRFNRIIKMGSSEFNRILIDYLSIDGDEAEKRKKTTSVTAIYKSHGQMDKTASDSDDDIKNIVIRESVNYFDEVIDEIDKVFKYHLSRHSSNKIDQVFLIGGGAQFVDLEELLSSRLELPVKKLDKLNNVEFNLKDSGELKHMNLYINSIGALIRE